MNWYGYFPGDNGLSHGSREFEKKYPNKKMSRGAINANRINL
jgi:hypothetical protein